MLKIENTNETIRLYEWFTNDREKNNDFNRFFMHDAGEGFINLECVLARRCFFSIIECNRNVETQDCRY